MTPLGKATAVVGALTVAITLFTNLTGGRLPGPLQDLPWLDSPSEQVTQEASGRPPWTVEGHGWRYRVESVTRTTSEWQFKKRPSITIVAQVTRTSVTRHAHMQYRISDQASGAALDGVPFQGGGDGDPPLNQPSRLVHVVWDTDPRATHLVFVLHDFYWPEGRDLILRAVPVPS